MFSAMLLVLLFFVLMFIEEDENGLVHVGKIRFDPKDILGRGCEGTVVFK